MTAVGSSIPPSASFAAAAILLFSARFLAAKRAGLEALELDRPDDRVERLLLDDALLEELDVVVSDDELDEVDELELDEESVDDV